MQEWLGFGDGLIHLLQWTVMGGLFGGTLIGIIIGAIPGLGASVGMALLLPLIFYWPPEVGLVLLSALWMADNYGGSISSIILGIPGHSGAIMTIEDGHPMSQHGKTSMAIGVALSASAIGGIIGAILFLFIAPPIAKVALLFGSAELVWLSFLGLTVVSTCSGDSLSKGLIACGFGFLVGLTGIDMITGYERFTFGTTYLMDRVELVLVLLGVFATARLLYNMAEHTQAVNFQKTRSSILQGMKLALRYPITLIRSSLIGTVFGAIPGMGHSIAAVVAYQQTIAVSRHPQAFGKGNPEGVVAPESANNAVQGGSLIPTFTLGIPGSASAVVFLAGLAMYGLRVGPHIFIENSVLVWTIWWSMIGAVVCFLLLGPLLNRFFIKTTMTPPKFLIPIVIVLVIGGAITSNHSPLDLVTVLFFAIVGYFMLRHKYPLMAFVLGFILGPIAEENFFRSLLISGGSFGIFIKGIINPTLIFIILLSLALYFRGHWRKKQRQV